MSKLKKHPSGQIILFGVRVFVTYEDTNLYNDMGMTYYKEKVTYDYPMFQKAYKSYRISFFEKVKMHKVSHNG